LEVTAESPAQRAGIKEKMSADLPALAARLWAASDNQSVEAVRLSASSRTPHWMPPRQNANGGKLAPRSERAIWWDQDRATPTAVFAREQLGAGIVIDGPAVVEGADTTYAIRPDWRLAIDQFGSLSMARQSRER
jgi:N-methylhydantoinase A/oxoprolinase/acetone carboxylase beta subunit